MFFSSALAIVRLLRGLGCYLPVEVWVAKGEEVDAPLVASLEKEGIFISDASSIVESLSIEKGDRAFYLKPVALVYSRFRHVLLLDADNFPVQNPESLFSSEEYKKTGALFWPHFRPLEDSNVMWTVIRKEYVEGMRQDSGQLVIDKKRHWGPLMLALYLNIKHKLFYEHTAGDKETFHYSWRAMDAPFTMIRFPPGGAGSMDASDAYHGTTMVQHGLSGERLFLHRNLQK